jgi:hypothetical protein
MTTLIVQTAIGSLVAIVISFPIGIVLGRLFESEPASWRALRRRARRQKSRFFAGDPWASATISYGTVRVVDIKPPNNPDQVVISNSGLTASSGTIVVVGS